jgi:hypothetical protein
VTIRFLHKTDLTLDLWHPFCESRRGILRIVGTGVIIDAEALRADADQKIITDEPETICEVLGIPFPDEQVVQERN